MGHDGAVPPDQTTASPGRLPLALHLSSLLIGIAVAAMVTYGVGSLADAFYASRHSVPAASGTGNELGLELVVIFGMFMGFVASIPLGFAAYRFVLKRLSRLLAVA